MVERPSVIRTGAIPGTGVPAKAIRSTSEEANIAVTAAVELSGPATANGSELPSAMTKARIADAINVAATP